jgi:predicted DCC family thiol-disulfide oxidoreductase YuxK
MISLASELTDSKGRHARAWLFFDRECEFCARMAAWLSRPMKSRGLAVAPLQDPRVGVLLGLSREELRRAIRFVVADGKQYLGADAMLAVARELWWARPLLWLSNAPGMLPVMRAGYRWVAQWRRCSAQDGRVESSCSRNTAES